MHQYQLEEDLIQKRKEELKHATDIRELYEQKLEKANNLYFELSTVLLQLDQREHELIKREKALNIKNERIVRPILRRESSNRTKSYSKRNIQNKSSNDIDDIDQYNLPVVQATKSAEDIHEQLESTNSIGFENNQLTTSMGSLKDCDFNERAIDTIQYPIEGGEEKVAKLIDGSEVCAVNVMNTPRLNMLKKLIRSKSVNSIDSYTKNPPPFKEGESNFTREDSLPPSYPSVLANRIRTGYYSEANLYFNSDSQPISVEVKEEIVTPEPLNESANKKTSGTSKCIIKLF